jgi:surfeit locus 1 family protein
MRFRPTFWPTVITAAALAVTVGLAIWQGFYRLDEKTRLIEELQTRGAGPVIPLPLDDRIPAEDLVFRPVSVTGHYMHEAEMRLLNRVSKGIPGMNLVTPFRRADGGPTLLIDRGWVPLDWPGTPTAGDGDEPVTVTGIVREPEKPGFFTPGNDTDRNQWYSIDLSEMAGSAGVLPFVDYYLYATGESSAPGDYPASNEWRMELPNNHLSYAITWATLAIAILVIYVIYHLRRFPDEEQDGGA